MMAVRYHGCTCHQRYQGNAVALSNGHTVASRDNNNRNGSADQMLKNGNGVYSSIEEPSSNPPAGGKPDEPKPQPWYFHVVASLILVVHGFTFLVPSDPDSEDTDMVRTIAKWAGYEMDWVKCFTPYAQGLASVFNISLGIVSWWSCKESDRYNRLIQLRVFAFCVNILHAYITGPIIYQNEDVPLMAPGRIIGLFRLSYLTPGLMAAGVTEVIVEKEQETSKDKIDYEGDAGGGESDTNNALVEQKKKK